MSINLPPPEDVLGVAEAFHWLQGQHNDVEAHSVLISARHSGLLMTQERGHWSVADSCLKQALSQATILPSDTELLAKIIHGIGEIAARCHVDMIPPIHSCLVAQENPNLMSEVLDVLVDLASQGSPEFKLEERALAQQLKRETVSWNTFNNAAKMIEGYYSVSRRYGFKYAVTLALNIDAKKFSNWLDRQEEHPILATVVDSLHKDICSSRDEGIVTPLIASNNDFLRCFAAASIVSPRRTFDEILFFKECWQTLVDNGICGGDAIWMVGLRLKNAIHNNYNLNSCIKRDRARLEQVKHNPEAAAGGSRYAEHEIERFGKSEVDLSDELSVLHSAIEQILVEMAECWPSEGLTLPQMSALEKTFVDTAEFRYRLGEKLTHPGNRNWLFNQNIKQVLQLAGASRAFDVVASEYFGFHGERHDSLLFWGAKSHLLRWEGNAGRRLGISVEEFAEKSEAFLEMPFSYSCHYEKWINIVGRLSVTHLFAFHVIENIPEHRHSEVNGLPRIVLKQHVQFLLRASMDQWPLHQQPLIDQLAQTAVYFIQKDPGLSDLRQEWIVDKMLPDFPRALAIWSDVNAVHMQFDLAKELFSTVTQRPLYEKENSRYFNRLLGLLDLAIATCWQADDSNLIDCLLELWSHVREIWIDEVDDHWLDAAQWFVEALSSEGGASDRLLEHPGLTQSYCRLVLEQRQVIRGLPSDFVDGGTPLVW